MIKLLKKWMRFRKERGPVSYSRSSGVQVWKPSTRGKNSMGFTLIELILFMGLVSILLVVLMQVFSVVTNVQVESEKVSNVIQDGRYILGRLNYDVARAQSIDIPVSTGSTTNSLQLTINEAGVDRVFTYSLSDGRLNIVNYLGTNSLNSIFTTISNFSVTRIGNASGKHTVTMSFTITSTAKIQSGYEIQNFSTTMGLR